MNTEMQGIPLIPQLEQRRKEVEQIKLEVETLTSGLTVEQLSWSPAPDVWSVALCLDHLNRVGYIVVRSWNRRFKNCKGVTGAMGDRFAITGWSGSFFEWSGPTCLFARLCHLSMSLI